MMHPLKWRIIAIVSILFMAVITPVVVITANLLNAPPFALCLALVCIIIGVVIVVKKASDLVI